MLCCCVFLLGLGSRVLRGAGKGKGKLDQSWDGELRGLNVHNQLFDRHDRGVDQDKDYLTAYFALVRLVTVYESYNFCKRSLNLYFWDPV